MDSLAAFEPDIWVLLTQASGDNDQCLALAEALDSPVAIKRLDWHVLDATEDRAIVRNLLAETPQARQRRDALGLYGPWPRIVICCGRRSDRVGFWIKRQSGGRTKVVSIGRARRSIAAYDLLVAPPQFSLPERSNVIPLPLPLARRRPNDADRDPQRNGQRSNMIPVPKPWFTILLGGEIKQFAASAHSLSQAARRAQAAADRHGGSVVVSSSRRTPPELLAVVESALVRPYVYRWSEDSEANPYDALLQQSAALLVTSDSVSMILDGCSSGTPTYVIEYPERLDLRRRLRRRMFGVIRATADRFHSHNLGLVGDGLDRAQEWLHVGGFLRYPRDLRRFHSSVYSMGLARPMAEFDPSILPQRGIANDLTEASGLRNVVARLRAL